jgi:hypothetical protein
MALPETIAKFNVLRVTLKGVVVCRHIIRVRVLADQGRRLRWWESQLGCHAPYKIVGWSRLWRSKARMLPSALTETKMTVDPGNYATSYTTHD